MKLRRAAAAVLLFTAAAAAHADVLINEGFNNVATLATNGWILANASTPIGTTPNWFQGDQQIFTSQAGAPDAYVAANYNNAGAGGTLANWLITPTFSTALSGTVTFWARSEPFDGTADRLAFGFSSGGSSFADFTLGSARTIGNGWTQYTVDYAAHGAGSTARFAIEYLGSADLSNYVGVDTLSVVAIPEPETWALFGLGLGALGFVGRRRKSGR